MEAFSALTPLTVTYKDRTLAATTHVQIRVRQVDEAKRQTELLGLIEREQAIENRAHHDRDRS